MVKKPLIIAALATTAVAATVSTPASAGDPALGALVGAGVGAAIGHGINGHNGAWVGGAIGALTGASIAANSGNYYGPGPAYYDGPAYMRTSRPKTPRRRSTGLQEVTGSGPWEKHGKRPVSSPVNSFSSTLSVNGCNGPPTAPILPGKRRWSTPSRGSAPRGPCSRRRSPGAASMRS